MPASLVELQHVSVVRGETAVLHNVDFSLRAGEHLALLGPNGCGKSTLLKTLTCELYPLVRPETRVQIFGRSRWDLTELRKRLGVVSPDLPGKPMLRTTGFDALLTGFFSSSTLWPNLEVTDSMRVRAEEVLGLVSATNLRDRVVGEMSAGQRQRILIGRALIGSSSRLAEDLAADAPAAMLLLDEPSNALDLYAQRELRELLRRLARSGVTLFLITHQVADIIPEIGRVVMMREGRIVEDGDRAALLTEERLSELFSTDVRLTEREGFLHAW